MFSKLPEEPIEWAGLPSEPARAETAAERLTDAGGVGLDGMGIGFADARLGGGAVESIVIPVSPAVEIAESQESGEGE